jgi:hypothetical protein
MDIVEFEPVGQRIAVLAAAVFSVRVYMWLEDLHDANKQAIFHPLIALALVLPVAAVVHSWTDFLVCKLPMRFHWSRRLLSHIASIEGYWLQCVYDTPNPFSILCIEFDPAKNSYRYHGTNYNKNGTLNAHFDSEHASIEASGNELTFKFVAAVYRQNRAQNNVDIDGARGYGTITFTTETGRNFVSGRGEFFEASPDPNWRRFELFKISRTTVKSALNRTHADDDIDYSTLLTYTLLDRKEKEARADRALSDRLAAAHEAVLGSPAHVRGDVVRQALGDEAVTVEKTLKVKDAPVAPNVVDVKPGP